MHKAQALPLGDIISTFEILLWGHQGTVRQYHYKSCTSV